jgi:short-subunit dehydrogenase
VALHGQTHEITNATVLVTGANRGLGRALVTAFLDRGARRVIAAMRDLASSPFDDNRIEAIPLDVTSDKSVEALTPAFRSTDILVNNAAFISNNGFLTDDLTSARMEMETNYWGVLRMCRAFVKNRPNDRPALIVNILSLGALANIPFAGTYSSSKAAAHSLTQGLRADLRNDEVAVLAAYPGAIATEMARQADSIARHPPELVAHAILSGIEAGEATIFPDPSSAELGLLYAQSPATLEECLSGSSVDDGKYGKSGLV